MLSLQHFSMTLPVITIVVVLLVVSIVGVWKFLDCFLTKLLLLSQITYTTGGIFLCYLLVLLLVIQEEDCVVLYMILSLVYTFIALHSFVEGNI